MQKDFGAGFEAIPDFLLRKDRPLVLHHLDESFAHRLHAAAHRNPGELFKEPAGESHAVQIGAHLKALGFRPLGRRWTDSSLQLPSTCSGGTARVLEAIRS